MTKYGPTPHDKKCHSEHQTTANHAIAYAYDADNELISAEITLFSLHRTATTILHSWRRRRDLSVTILPFYELIHGLSEASFSTMVKWGESCGIAQLGLLNTYHSEPTCYMYGELWVVQILSCSLCVLGTTWQCRLVYRRVRFYHDKTLSDHKITWQYLVHLMGVGLILGPWMAGKGEISSSFNLWMRPTVVSLTSHSLPPSLPLSLPPSLPPSLPSSLPA